MSLTVTPRSLASAALVALVALVAASAAAAAPAAADLVRVWVPLRMRVGEERLARELEAVSDPRSPRYGRYLSQAAVAALVGAPDASVRAVERWMAERLGATRVAVSATRDAVTGLAPRGRVAHSRHPDGLDLFAAGADDAAVREAVDFVRVVLPEREPSALSLAERVRVWRRAEGGAATAEASLGTPSAQKEAAGVPAGLNGTHAGNAQMVWGPGSYGYLESDLASYQRQFGVPQVPGQVTRLGGRGSPGGDNFGEASLDVDTIVGQGTGVATVVANTNSSSSTEEGPGFGPALVDFALLLGNQSDAALPAVVSMSLGSLSHDSCVELCRRAANATGTTQAGCMEYVQYHQRQVCMMGSGKAEDRANAEFAKLGLRGVTLLGASGDGGSHYSFQPFEGDQSGLDQALNDASCAGNWPTFPASSPYVTGVGGSTWGGGASPQDPAAWSASGGGFSWRYPAPSYQRDAVRAYLAAAPAAAPSSGAAFPAAGAFRADGRAYPDVAALATGVPMVTDGQTFPAGGTSAAAPSFAGVVSLLNGQRLRAGLAPLGFLNPRLYQVAAKFPGEAFRDLDGGTSACNSAGSCCGSGFPVTKGWDPVSGFGTPVWSGLSRHFASSP